MVVAVALCGFVPGGRNVFWNASSGTIAVAYQSSTIGPIKTHLRRGTSLDMSNDKGEVISLRITYPDGRVQIFTADELQRLKVLSHADSGIWWITDQNVRFLSTRDGVRERAKFRKHAAREQHEASNQAMQPTARRRTASLSMTTELSFQASLVLTSGG
jgi:hypothetical protein